MSQMLLAFSTISSRIDGDSSRSYLQSTLVISLRLKPILAAFLSNVTDILALRRHIGLNLNIPLSRFKSFTGSILSMNYNILHEKG